MLAPQAVIEHALTTLLRESRDKLKVVAAGRTDRGVHAAGQVVQLYSDHPDLEEQGLTYNLNRLLPPDVRVLSLLRTASDFNVTISAITKVRRGI
jgi:tRNA pseudouridine38-40 synthase